MGRSLLGYLPLWNILIPFEFVSFLSTPALPPFLFLFTLGLFLVIFFFFLTALSFFMCTSILPASMSVSHVCVWCQQRSEGGITSSGAAVTDGREQPCGSFGRAANIPNHWAITPHLLVTVFRIFLEVVNARIICFYSSYLGLGETMI